MKQVRVEIIANRAIEEDVIEVLETVGYGETFTVVNPVYGRGTSGWREASSVWPETNVIIIVYLDRSGADRLTSALVELKKNFPREGLRCWEVESAVRLL